MEKLKDFLYDKNDILVALIIVVIASLVISGRINAIMSYPGTLTEGESQGNVIESELTANTADEKAGSHSSKGKDADAHSNVIQGAPNTGDKNKDKPKFNHSLYVEYGSSINKIAEDLVNGGLLKTKEEFITAVTSLNADSKIKAGTFIIPDGSSAEEIVKIIIS